MKNGKRLIMTNVNSVTRVVTLLLLIYLMGCSKEEISTTDATAKEMEGSMLVFESRNDFEESIKEGEKNLRKSTGNENFISLKQASTMPALRKKASELEIKSDFMQNVLNSDGLVQIGSWIFKINEKQQKVTALNILDKKYIKELKEDIEVQGKIYAFSTEDDVLDLLGNGITTSPKANERAQLFCSESGVSQLYKEEGFSDLFIYNNNQVQGYSRMRYLKDGIYFELRIFSAISDPDHTPPYYKVREYWYKAKCGSEHHLYGEGPGEYNETVNLNPWVEGKGDDEKIYASSTALHKYKVVATYTWKNDQGSDLQTLTQISNHGY